jgi:hypothetical protein
LEGRVLQSIVGSDFPPEKCRLRELMLHAIDLDICCDDAEIVTLILIDLIGESIRMLVATANLGDLTMSDHHIESIAWEDGPLIFITDCGIIFLSFLRYLEAEKTTRLTCIRILDHTDTQLIAIFLVYCRLDKPLPALTITDTDPLRMVRIHDELAFYFYISRHIEIIYLLREKCKYLFLRYIFPVFRFFIYSICSYLPDLS